MGEVWLVDPNEKMLSSAVTIFPGKTSITFSEIVDKVDLVIIAAPNATHFRLANEAISANKHVLIEKPFVTFPAEGVELISKANSRNLVAAVNQTRRIFPVARELRRKIGDGEFGSLISIEHFEGVKLSWPFESGAAFAKGAHRTGVIMDLGVHVIDFYHYILQPHWKFIEAIHDGFNGPEGLAFIRLQADGAPITIRLSRYQMQANVAELTFTNAKILVDVYDWNTYSILDRNGGSRRIAAANPVDTFSDIATAVLSNFIAATQGQEVAICDASSSIEVIELLDVIYNQAVRFPAAVGLV